MLHAHIANMRVQINMYHIYTTKDMDTMHMYVYLILLNMDTIQTLPKLSLLYYKKYLLRQSIYANQSSRLATNDSAPD